ncbi:hypothetical protein BDN67DRAFT_767398 [Paxillus ammoniavirescens]|nr:hypothetical protein BDN67DRAFT_767398 [Paxillus ammoniavirescens]
MFRSSGQHRAYHARRSLHDAAGDCPSNLEVANGADPWKRFVLTHMSMTSASWQLIPHSFKGCLCSPSVYPVYQLQLTLMSTLRSPYPQRSTAGVIIKLPKNQATPPVLSELQNHPSPFCWESRVRSIIEAASSYFNPVFSELTPPASSKIGGCSVHPGVQPRRG